MELPPAETTPAWDEVAGRFREPFQGTWVDASQFVFDSSLIRPSRSLADFARPSFPTGRPILAAVADLNRRIHAQFIYDPRATNVSTPVESVLILKRGVCQDFAQVAIGCLRSLGLAARYVSGYLRTRPLAGGPRLIGADASHAWFSVFCPGIGWIDYDPTNNMLPTIGHVTVAVGRDFSDISPLSGIVRGGGGHTVHVAVDVEPLELSQS